MKIILTIHDEKGKNILFILDNLQSLTLAETINLVKRGEISGLNIVKSKRGTYVRSHPNITKKDNLDFLSISLKALTHNNQRKTSSAVKDYLQLRQQFLRKKEDQDEKVIYIDGKRKETEKEIVNYLSGYKKIINRAAKNLNVDSYLLGAILIDEHLRLDWLDAFDWLTILGRKPSVGIAQIKIETARELIKRKFYLPDPADKELKPENVAKVSAKSLSKYLENPEHSVCFAAARMNQLSADWAKYIDLKKNPEVLASLYSMGKKPHPNPLANDRGKQIAGEFYEIAKKTLKL